MTRQQAEALVLGIDRCLRDAEQGRPRSDELSRLVARAILLGARSVDHLWAIARGEAPPPVCPPGSIGDEVTRLEQGDV